MNCPGCGCAETRTIDSRTAGMAVMRSRRCEACSGAWGTFETPIDGSFRRTPVAAVSYPSLPVAKGGGGDDSVSALSPSGQAAPQPSQQSDQTRARVEQRYPADFLEFWKLYPKRIAKAAALRAWLRKRPNIDVVRAAVARQLQWRRWKDGFIKDPATWINGGCWDDEPENDAPRRSGGGGSPGPASPVCEFHRRADNRERAAPKPLARKECPECQHTGSLLHPRPPSDPTSMGDLLKKLGGGA